MSEVTIAGMSLDEWHRRCAEYVERLNALPPEQTRHANCDHAYGICMA